MKSGVLSSAHAVTTARAALLETLWSGHERSGCHSIVPLVVVTFFHTSPRAFATATPPIDTQSESTAVAAPVLFVCTSRVTTAGVVSSVYVIVTFRLAASCVHDADVTCGASAMDAKGRVETAATATAAFVSFFLFIVFVLS